MDAALLFFFSTITSTEGFLLASALIAIFLIRRSGTRSGAKFVLAGLLLMLVTVALKMLVAAPRPLHPLIAVTGYAFPSGHAAGAMFLALVICILNRKARVAKRYAIYAASILFALIIGASRVYYGAHTVFQVVVGFLLGGIIAYFWYRVAEANEHKRTKRH